MIEQILHGDCLELMKAVPDKSIDMILADLPYGTIACAWDTVIPFEPLWAQYERIIKDNGVIVLTASQPFTSALVMSNIKLFRYEWIWNKVSAANFMNLSNRPFKTQENVLVFSKSANFTFNPIRVLRTETSLKRDPIGSYRQRSVKKKEIPHYNANKLETIVLSEDGKKHPIDIITFGKHDSDSYKFNHPTKKPVALFEYLIKTYTNKGDLVLDNTAGSGTTAVAAINLQRQFIVMEKEQEYIETIKKRVQQAKLQLKLDL